MRSERRDPTVASRLSVRALLGNASRLASGDVVRAVCSIAQGMVIARALGPDNYGRWGLVCALAGTVSALLSSATAVVLTRYLVHYRANDDRDGLALLLASATLLELLLGVTTAAIVAAIGRLHLYEGIPAAVYGIYGLTTFVMFTRKIWASVCQDMRQFSIIAWRIAAGSLLQLIIIVVFWRLGEISLTRLAWLFVISHAIPAIWEWRAICATLRCYGLSITTLPWTAVWRRRGELAEMWHFAGQMYVSTSVVTLFTQVDTLILGAFRPAGEVGYYRLGKNLFLSLISLGLNVARVAYRDFNDLVAANRYRELLRASHRLNLSWLPATLLGTALLAAISPWLVPALYGQSYQPAVWPFVLQLIGAAASIALSWAGYLLLALGQQRRYLKILILSAVGATPLMVLGAWLGGCVGVALASSALWVCHSVVSSRAANDVLRRMAEQQASADGNGEQAPSLDSVPGLGLSGDGNA